MTWYNVNLKNIFCYEKHRFKMYEDLQTLYKLYLSGDLGGTQQPPQEEQPPCGNTFCDNFEANWHSLNTYISQFGETFEVSWFIDNNYVNDYKEEFDTQWFVDNNYTSQWDEDFEGVDWNE